MLANAAQSESICVFTVAASSMDSLLNCLYTIITEGSPHSLMLIDSLSVRQVKSLS